MDCRRSEPCLFAERAQSSALDAIETAGCALGLASQAKATASEAEAYAASKAEVQALASDMCELKSKVSIATVISGAMGALAVIVAAVLGFLAVMTPSKVTARVQEVASATAEGILRQRLPTIEAVANDAAERSSDRALAKFVERQNPPPLKRLDVIVAKFTKAVDGPIDPV
jgi:hypothetical protein